MDIGHSFKLILNTGFRAVNTSQKLLLILVYSELSRENSARKGEREERQTGPHSRAMGHGKKFLDRRFNKKSSS